MAGWRAGGPLEKKKRSRCDRLALCRLISLSSCFFSLLPSSFSLSREALDAFTTAAGARSGVDVDARTRRHAHFVLALLASTELPVSSSSAAAASAGGAKQQPGAGRRAHVLQLFPQVGGRAFIRLLPAPARSVFFRRTLL